MRTGKVVRQMPCPKVFYNDEREIQHGVNMLFRVQGVIEKYDIEYLLLNNNPHILKTISACNFGFKKVVVRHS